MANGFVSSLYFASLYVVLNISIFLSKHQKHCYKTSMVLRFISIGIM